jgi:predicted ABC-type transport system involved in lysophospholipase L1 biosynthesis ATPase subunit
LFRNQYRFAANQRSSLHAKKIGFVFQQFHLVPYLIILENILAPSIAGLTPDDSEQTTCEVFEHAKELVYHFKLEHRINHLPSQLSVG